MEPSTPLGLAYDPNPLCSRRELIEDEAEGKAAFRPLLSNRLFK